MTRPGEPPLQTHPARWGLATRLALAQVLVLLVMVATLVTVGALVGPRVFDQHLRAAGHANQPHVLEHAQEAFRAAGLTAAIGGLLVATLAAAATSTLVMGQLVRGLSALATGARRVAAGDHDHRVELAGAIPEVHALGRAFNDMAAQISHTEATRRRLLTDVAHELRTPIAAIDVTLESLEDGVVTADSDTLATLRAQTARLTRLADDIRAVSAAEEGRLTLHPHRVRVADLVEDATSAAAPGYAGRGVPLAADPVPADLTVRADPARLLQVLDNLLRNALQHSAPGQRVELRVRQQHDEVVFEVRDRGTGIAAEHLPHLFERFYRVDGARPHGAEEGTGVGLAIARSIALAHGGRLEAESAGLGQGARFTLALPAGRKS